MSEKKLQVTCLRRPEDFRALRTEWSRLLAQSKNRNVFLSWEWLYAWWEVFAEDNRLYLLTVREKGNLIGVAPLMLTLYKKAFFTLRVLRCIGTPQSDIGGLLALRNEAVSQAVADYLERHKEEWYVLEMNVLPTETFRTELFASVFSPKKYLSIRRYDEHFYLPLHGTWDEYMGRLSKNMRRNLRRRVKRANELGKLRYRRYFGDNLEWTHFLTLFELNEKGKFPEIYRSSKNKAFLEKIYALTKDQWLQVEMLYLDNQAIAFQCGFLFDQKYQDWRGGYDRDYEKLGAGKLLMMFSIEDNYKRAVQEVDFLRGAYAYKADWRPQKRKFVDWRIFRKDSKEALAAYFWLKELKPRLKRKKGHEKNFF